MMNKNSVICLRTKTGNIIGQLALQNNKIKLAMSAKRMEEILTNIIDHFNKDGVPWRTEAFEKNKITVNIVRLTPDHPQFIGAVYAALQHYGWVVNIFDSLRAKAWILLWILPIDKKTSRTIEEKLNIIKDASVKELGKELEKTNDELQSLKKKFYNKNKR